MPLVFDKANKRTEDTDSGASVSDARHRMGTAEYFLEVNNERFLITATIGLEYEDPDKWSVPPLKKFISLNYFSQILDWDLLDIASERWNRSHFKEVDYRPYKSIMGKLLEAHARKCRDDWPTEIIVEFDHIENSRLESARLSNRISHFFTRLETKITRRAK